MAPIPIPTPTPAQAQAPTPNTREASMRKRERGRRTAGTALALAAVCGAVTLFLGGCGQSGDLYLPERSSLAAGAAVPAVGPVAAAGRLGAVAARLPRA